MISGVAFGGGVVKLLLPADVDSMFPADVLVEALGVRGTLGAIVGGFDGGELHVSGIVPVAPDGDSKTVDGGSTDRGAAGS